MESHNIIEDDIVLYKYNEREIRRYNCEYLIYKKLNPMVLNGVNGYRYTPIKGAIEWCEENNIDPMNMSEEDTMAFKLRWE